jgi:hypothetical protein
VKSRGSHDVHTVIHRGEKLIMVAMLSVWSAWASLAISIVAVLLAAVRLSSGPAVRSLRSEVASLKAESAEVTELLRKLENRDRMRRVRAGLTSESSPKTISELPDPYANPQEWKKAMRTKLPAALAGHKETG